MRDDRTLSTIKLRQNWLNSLKGRTAFSLMNSKFGCIKNKDTTDSEGIKCKRIGNVMHLRYCCLCKEPALKDDRIKVTEVMEYKTQTTDRPVSVRGKIYKRFQRV